MTEETELQHHAGPGPARKKAIIALSAVVFLILLLPFSVLTLRWVNPPVTMFTLLENWGEIDRDRYSLREWWVPADEIPEHLKWAAVAAEDQLFFEHRGFDMESIREAWEQRQEGTRNRGASTISQQVAKNLYLWPAHSFFRKGVEAVITVFIEFFWPKERIMEVYLNIAEFGPGLFGIGQAADHFYGIHPSNLQPEQAARLTAVLPSPKRMRVEPPSPYTLDRSVWILRQMGQLSGIRYLGGEEPAGEPEPIPEPAIPDSLLFDLDIELDPLPETDDTTNSLEQLPQIE